MAFRIRIAYSEINYNTEYSTLYWVGLTKLILIAEDSFSFVNQNPAQKCSTPVNPINLVTVTMNVNFRK